MTIFLTTLLLITSSHTLMASNTQIHPKLIFSLDQGFGNGVIVQCDRTAVTRICHALRPLQKCYDVYLLVNPQVADKKKLETVLDILVSQNVPFMFDVCSSDTHQLSITKQNAAHDPLHGFGISVEELDRYKQRYGKWLSGIRFAEVLAHDFSVYAMKTTNPEWKRPELELPKDDFFKPETCEQFIKYAAEHGMFAQWSDWHWIEFAGWDKKQSERERHLLQMIRKHPGVVYVTYANNEPNEDSVKRLSNWQNSVKKFIKDGAAGYGLSDQSWMRGDTTCPAEDIIQWARNALDQGCKIVQFEPVWYFFRLPRGSFGIEEYKSDAAWTGRGAPTDNYVKLRDTLLEILIN